MFTNVLMTLTFNLKLYIYVYVCTVLGAGGVPGGTGTGAAVPAGGKTHTTHNFFNVVLQFMFVTL